MSRAVLIRAKPFHILDTFPLVFPDDAQGRARRAALLVVYDRHTCDNLTAASDAPDSKESAMRTLSYRILLREEPEGGYTVTVPTLPGCVTYGESIPEAVAMAKEAIEGYVESLLAHGEEVPTEDSTLSAVAA
jgi:predicted RNase H-like HicB family nuclease